MAKFLILKIMLNRQEEILTAFAGDGKLSNGRTL
jgi:hypothetical protein